MKNKFAFSLVASFGLIGFTALALLSCTHTQSREVAHDGSHDLKKTITAESLFLRGKFNIKKVGGEEDHFGQDLDLSTRRPLVNLDGTAFSDKYSIVGAKLYGNFYYRGKFYVARIPQGAVKSLYFQLVRLAPDFSTSQSVLRFEMSMPIYLVCEMPSEEAVDKGLTAQNMPVELKEPIQINNFVLSAEAQWTKADPKKSFEVARANNGAYVQILRVMAVEDRLRDFYNNGSRVEQIQLDIFGAASVIQAALERSEKDGISKPYSLQKYNITTTAFDIYQESAGIAEDRVGFIRKWVGRPTPVFTPIQLARFGGVKAPDMHLDKSLAAESKEAYNDVVAFPKRQLCPLTMSKDSCRNLHAAVKILVP